MEPPSFQVQFNKRTKDKMGAPYRCAPDAPLLLGRMNNNLQTFQKQKTTIYEILAVIDSLWCMNYLDYRLQKILEGNDWSAYTSRVGFPLLHVHLQSNMASQTRMHCTGVCV